MKIKMLLFALAFASQVLGQKAAKEFDIYVAGGYFTSATLSGRFDNKTPISWLKSGHATFGVGYKLTEKWQQRPEIFIYDVGYSSGGYSNSHGVYGGIVYQFVYNPEGVIQPSFGPYVSTLLFTIESPKSEYTHFDAGILTRISIRPIRQYGFAAYIGFTIGLIDMYEFTGTAPYGDVYNKYSASALLVGASWGFGK